MKLSNISKWFFFGVLLSLSSYSWATTGVIEDDGNAKRFVYDEPLSKEACDILTKSFLGRFDIIFKASLYFFNKYHKPESLIPSEGFKSKYTLLKRSVLQDEMVTISKPQRANNRHVIYLHGGAYVYAKKGLKEYEGGIELMLEHLGDRVTFVDYPGTSNADYEKILATAKAAYYKLAEEYPGDEFVLFGNSAGSNLSLLLAQQLKKEQHAQRPQKIILLSPWADISVDNPDMPKYEFWDTILSISGIKYAADLFRGDVDYKDPRVSPLYGDFDQLGDIAIFVGNYDLVYPDSLRLYEKAKSSGLRVHHYQYNKMWHDYMVLKPTREAALSWGQASEFVNP